MKPGLAVIVSLFVCLSAVAGPDTSRPLQAIFMEVQGKVRWRVDDAAPWRDAAVNDLVDAGAEIRTGLRSRATLRVGRNASVLVDAGTTFQLPTIVQEGEVLRTVAAVRSGRVDFKVDKLDGFANDAKVITPQTTLSVRGTGFAVASGVLNGVEVTGARTNMINAIELTYVAGNLKYFLSGDARSSSARQDPVKSAWVSTLGPPQVAGTIVDAAQLEQAVAQGNAGNAPTNPQQFQQIAAAEANAQAATDSPLDGLLDMQSRAADAANEAADVARDLAQTALANGNEALEAAQARDAAMQLVLDRRDLLEAAWTGEQDLETDLSDLAAESEEDLARMGSLRAELDTILAAEQGGAANDAAGFAKMDAMHAVDDAWQETLLSQSRQIVSSVQALNASLQTAFTAASGSDATFSALRDEADGDATAMRGAIASLISLKAAVQAYRDDVRRLVAAGQAGAGAAAALVRSVELLTESVARVARALQRASEAEAALASATSLGERVLLTAAIAAAARGEEVEGLAEDQLAIIEANASAIESARFSAFFAAVATAVAAVPEQRDAAVAAAELAVQGDLDVRPLADAAEEPARQVRELADGLDSFWNQVGEGQVVSRRVRMENLRDQSAEDLTQMQGLLGQLGDSIGANDESSAITQLASMQTIHDPWRDDGGAALAEARTIDDDIQTLNGQVQASHTAFQAGSGNAFSAKLAEVKSARDAAVASADRLQAMRDRLQAYAARYQQITGPGGRGGEFAGQLATTLASIEAVQQQIQDSLDASDAARAAAERATTYGGKVFFAATSQRALDSAGIAAASAALRTQIEQNAAGIQGAFAQGQADFEGAFGTGQGGGG